MRWSWNLRFHNLWMFLLFKAIIASAWLFLDYYHFFLSILMLIELSRIIEFRALKWLWRWYGILLDVKVNVWSVLEFKYLVVSFYLDTWFICRHLWKWHHVVIFFWHFDQFFFLKPCCLIPYLICFLEFNNKTLELIEIHVSLCLVLNLYSNNFIESWLVKL